jgi:hypothetical protein
MMITKTLPHINDKFMTPDAATIILLPVDDWMISVSQIHHRARSPLLKIKEKNPK